MNFRERKGESQNGRKNGSASISIKRIDTEND
jgi:hypothetical protein